MNCRDVSDLVHAYADDELDVISVRQVDEHLEACRECRGRLETVRTVKVASGKGLYFKAPGELRAKVLGVILEEEGLSKSSPTLTLSPSTSLRPGRQEGGLRIRWGAWAMAAAAAIVLAGTIFTVLRDRSDDRMVAEVLTAHVRSLQPGHLMDVISTDQHTVKPWFDSHVDFSPPVKQLESAGFPLVGGRLDYLEDRPVASLVYARGKHTINVFVWPAETGSGNTQRRGFNFVHWSAGGMTFWAVSDLNAQELEAFTQLLRNEAMPATRLSQ